MQERYRLAKLSAEKFGMSSIPILVDPMDNNANIAFGAWPERLYILQDKEVVFKGGPGPYGYDLDAIEAWLTKNVK